LRLRHHSDQHQQQQHQQLLINYSSSSSLSQFGIGGDYESDVRRLCNGSTLFDLFDVDDIHVGIELVVNLLCLYVTPILVLLGVVGNTMSFLVFSMTHLRRQSSSVYLASLPVRLPV
jgi:hypothetical protein